MPADLAHRFYRKARSDGLLEAVRTTKIYLFLHFVQPLKTMIKLWYLRFTSGGCTIIREVNGSRMELDIQSSGPNKIERTLAVNGVREAGATEVFEDVLRGLMNERMGTIRVFDIGANVGYFALLEAYILGDSGMVYAIEADPENVTRLERNIELNGYDNIEVLPFAAGADWGELRFARMAASNVHKVADLVDAAAIDDEIRVEVRPLDALIEERNIPRDEFIVVRMDVEGYENSVLNGMVKLIDSGRPMFLFVEIHPEIASVNPEEIIDVLGDANFYPEYVSFDGGDTYRPLKSFDELRGIEYNTHLMASRMEPTNDQ